MRQIKRRVRAKFGDMYLMSFLFEDMATVPNEAQLRTFLLADWPLSAWQSYEKQEARERDQQWFDTAKSRLMQDGGASLSPTLPQSPQAKRLWHAIAEAAQLLSRALLCSSSQALRRLLLGRMCQLAALSESQERRELVQLFIQQLLDQAQKDPNSTLADDLAVAERFLRNERKRLAAAAREKVQQQPEPVFTKSGVDLSLVAKPKTVSVLNGQNIAATALMAEGAKDVSEEVVRITNIPLPIQDEALAQGRLSLFVESLDQHIETLHIALDKRDFVVGRQAAEQLRKSALQFDSREVAAACAAIVALIEVESSDQEIDAALHSLASLAYEIKERKRRVMTLKESA
jgi:hypothetical protein